MPTVCVLGRDDNNKIYIYHAAGWVIDVINIWPFNPFNPVGQNQ